MANMNKTNESSDINSTINVIQTVELLFCYFAFCIFLFCNWLGHGLVDTLKSIAMIIPNAIMSIPKSVINIYQVLTNDDVSFKLGTLIVALFVVLNVAGFIFARVHKE